MLAEKYGEDYKSFLKDFIRYLDQTSDDTWCTEVVRTKDGKGNCLFGHLSNFCGHKGEQNVVPDFEWFEIMVSTPYVVYPVNDGKDMKYKGDTPKVRCMLLMEAILDGREMNTADGMDAEYKKWLETNPQPL